MTETETDFGLFLNNLIYAFLLSTIITKKQSFVVHNLGGKRISYNNNIEKLRTFVLRIDLTVFLTGTCKDNLNNTKFLFFLYFFYQKIMLKIKLGNFKGTKDRIVKELDNGLNRQLG